MTTPVLSVPEVTDGQASQGAIHNTALRQFEAKIVRVQSRTTTAEPALVDGAAYIMPATHAGSSWGGFSTNQIAHAIGGVWQPYTPAEGWRVWVMDENVIVAYDGSLWEIQSSLLNMPGVAITSTTSVTAAHRGRALICDSTGGTITLNLLAAASAGNGFILAVKKKVAGNSIIIDPNGSELIDDATTLTLTADEDSRILMCDGSEWHALGGGGSGGGGITLPVSDATAIFKNDADATKTVKVDLSGLSTATERTVAYPNKSGTHAFLDDVAPGGNGSDQFAEDSANHNGLLYAYKAGTIRNNNVVTLVSAGTVLLTEGATNYVEINASGVVSANGSGFTSGRFPMAIVTTDAGSPSGIGTVSDRRAWATIRLSATFASYVRQALTNKTSFSGTGSEQWGTEEATLDDALLPVLTNVTIRALLSGIVGDTSTNNFLFYGVEISLDGGSTWNAGLQAVYRDTTGNVANYATLAAVHQVTGTVTGDIQARVMASCAAGASTSFNLEGGVIYLDVLVSV